VYPAQKRDKSILILAAKIKASCTHFENTYLETGKRHLSEKNIEL
jgi:hypothetical protein